MTVSSTPSDSTVTFLNISERPYFVVTYNTVLSHLSVMADDSQLEEADTDDAGELETDAESGAADADDRGHPEGTETDGQLEYSEETPGEQPGATGARATQQGRAQSDGSELPLKAGAVFGAGSFLVTYVVTLMVVYGSLSTGGATADEMAASYEAAGLTLLSSLGAEIQAGGEATSLLAATGATSELLALVFAVPLITIGAAAVLTAGAYGLVGYTDATGLEESLKTALLLVPGWLVLTLLTSFVASWETETGTEFAVATGEAFLFAGILFPAIFAIVGGLLATWPAPVDRVLERIGGGSEPSA